MLSDYAVSPATGAKAAHVVIFLHGVGDSGSGGLLSIGEMWAPMLPDTEFICPDAPFAFDMAPMGRQWFSLENTTPSAMLAGAKAAEPLLNAYIDHILTTREIAPGNLALVGFSQGTMMALYVGPRRSPQLAGIIGYSGALIGSESLALEKKSAPPTLLVHGTADEVVPFMALGVSEQGLKSAQIPVSTLACHGLGHSIDDNGLATGLKFLKQVFI